MPEPRFSIVTPVYETPPDVLRAMLRSVRRQRFRDWELCLVDDASTKPEVAAQLEAAEARDPRIRLQRRSENGGIVAASNDALAMARGEFIALLDHDDKLHPDALALVAETLDREPEADYLYTDEDKIDRRGLLHSGQFCKPDWSPERLRTQMYTCHLSVLRRTLVEEVGGFDPGFEGSQDWDLVLRVTERARRVVHVPRVLYHWRALESSTAGGGDAKPWAFEAGQHAVQAHCDRIGLQARVERDENVPGVYHLRPELTREPTVSIVIPTNGQRREVRYRQVTLVEHCVRSIVENSTYANYEIVCVADASTDPSVITELTALAGDRLRVVPYDREFNFSAKVNLGALHSEGELLLLLNDDMEVLTPEWIERMVMYAQHPGIGAVGARLLWEDGRLQHAGVLFENGGLPGHIYRGFRGDFKGYSNNACLAQNFLAVTGACLMTPAAAFDEVDGLSTTLPINYNDMDYCLKLRSKGLRVVYDPDTVLHHFESSSRSSDVEDWEKQALIDRWLPLTAVDPSTHRYLRHGLPGWRTYFAWAPRRLTRR